MTTEFVSGLALASPEQKPAQTTPLTPAPAANNPPPPASTPTTTDTPPAPRPPESVDALLVSILGRNRAFESSHEVEFMAWLRTELRIRGAKPTTMRVATGGCVVATIPRADDKASTVLFSCHTDTCHDASDPARFQLMYDPNMGTIFLDKESKVRCLGADDGAGVWLMLQMFTAKVPGTYVFHRGEERGCIGSAAMAAKEKEWLQQFEVAVAFDRPRDNEVITHMGGIRVCSDKFADNLAQRLTDLGLPFAKSNRGGLTDTRQYRHLIAECTNIGVGYQNQHQRTETLDYGHLVRLRDALIKIDWDSLPVDRDPTVKDEYYYGGHGRSPGGSTGYAGTLWDRDESGLGYYDGEDGGRYYGRQPSTTNVHPMRQGGHPNHPGSNKKNKKKHRQQGQHPAMTAWQERALNDPEPCAADEVLGVSIDDLAVSIEQMGSIDAAKLIVELAVEIASLRARVNALKGAL